MTEESDKEIAPSDDPKLKANQLEEAAAKKDSAVANARMDAANADKAEVDAQTAAQTAKYPAPATKPLEGKVEVGVKAGLVADLLAHSLIDDATDKILAEIKNLLDKDTSRVVLVENADLVASDWAYKAISEQLKYEAEELEAISRMFGPPPAAPPPTEPPEIMGLLPVTAATVALTSAVGGVADLVSMFRSDYEIAAREVTIGSTPLAAALAKRLIPETAEVNLDKFVLLEASALFERFKEVAATRLEVERRATELKEEVVAPADRKIAQAKEAATAYTTALGAKDAPPGLDALKSRMETLQGDAEDADGKVARARATVGVAGAAVARFDTLATAVTTAPDGDYPPLVAAAIRERLHTSEDQSGTSEDQSGTAAQGKERYSHVLFAAIESAGGETVTRRTIFRSSVRFMGGAQVSYLLWDVQQRRLVAAGTAPVLGQVKMGLGDGITDPVKAVRLGQREQ